MDERHLSADGNIRRTEFGQTGRSVTVVGLGGEGVLRTHGWDDEAETVIREALDRGIGYFDSARAYAGSEYYYGRVWSAHRDERQRVFQTSKSASRDREGALRDLEGTLATMRTDTLDLWQIHDLRTMDELEFVAAPGGALEAFVQAREEGKVLAIGVTGHHDPDVLARAVMEWPVDSVLLPVNPVEGVIGGFVDRVIPAALEKGAAVIGMKVLGASHYLAPEAGITAELLIRYALAHPITTAIVGCSTVEHVRILAETGRESIPMTEDEQRGLEDLYRPNAGRLAYYRGVI